MRQATSASRESHLPTLVVALPTYDGRRHNGSAMVDLCGIRNLNVRFRQSLSSLLTLSFNQAWADAINWGADFFLMVHEDILPVTEQWPAVLFNELAIHAASVLSVVSPIKTEHGLTSTALETDDPWHPRKLSLTEIMAKPETWTEEGLLVNTGLMLVDMRQAWVQKMCFTINDRIIRDEDGRFKAEVQPEDWNFTRAARAAGASIFCTRKVQLDHIGRAAFGNHTAWGAEVPEEILTS